MRLGLFFLNDLYLFIILLKGWFHYSRQHARQMKPIILTFKQRGGVLINFSVGRRMKALSCVFMPPWRFTCRSWVEEKKRKKAREQTWTNTSPDPNVNKKSQPNNNIGIKFISSSNFRSNNFIYNFALVSRWLPAITQDQILANSVQFSIVRSLCHFSYTYAKRTLPLKLTIHHMSEERNRSPGFFHVGIDLLPATKLTLPLCFKDKR